MGLKTYEGEAPRTGLYISALDSREWETLFGGVGEKEESPGYFCLSLEVNSGLSIISMQLQGKMLSLCDVLLGTVISQI